MDKQLLQKQRTFWRLLLLYPMNRGNSRKRDELIQENLKNRFKWGILDEA